MNLDILLIRASVSRAEQRRWFSTCSLAQNTLYVGDTGDCGVITRCYLDRLRSVLPAVTVTFQPIAQAANAQSAEPRYDDVPRYVKKSERKNYVKHHAARAAEVDLLGRK